MGRARWERFGKRLMRKLPLLRIKESKDYVIETARHRMKAQKYCTVYLPPPPIVLLRENPVGPLRKLPITRYEPTEFNIVVALAKTQPILFDYVLVMLVSALIYDAGAWCVCKQVTIENRWHKLDCGVTVATDLVSPWLPPIQRYFIKCRMDNPLFRTAVINFCAAGEG